MKEKLEKIVRSGKKLLTGAGLVSLLSVPAVISCGTESNETYNQPTVECYTNNDCLGNKVCEDNWCINPSLEPEDETPELCCGKIVYIEGYYTTEGLHVFDLDDGKDFLLENFSGAKWGGFEFLYKSSDNSKLVLSFLSGGCGGPLDTFFYLLDSDGTDMKGMAFIQPKSCLSVSPNPFPRILSNNSSILAILDSFSQFGVQIYRINSDETLKQLTSIDDGIVGVGSMTISPDNKVYFYGADESQDGLYMMDSNGNNKQLITELETNFGEMHWVPGKNQILASGNSAYESIVLVNPNTGDQQDLGVSGTDLIVSPNGDKFIYHKSAAYLFDLNSSKTIKINKDNFNCEGVDHCLSYSSGVWLP